MKRMKWILMIVALLVTLAVVVGIVAFIKYQSSYEAEIRVFTPTSEEAGEKIQIVAQVASEEEAKEVAELYGITFLKYRDGYGEYETTENYDTLKQIGLENNYPDLEILYKSYTK